ncbi:NGG1p interacting factor NIF3 [Ktedonosporobacter rubrisoli]|uniref:GTP cyclohydrolase 1 type 2 homolog n=1 Tax=Ktedonosporobacter rubrisoli TaxID=2509675 RepID=A0A4P6JHU9_KTERU|nr:Nif3-like dinuclear metal center hexameric protein [Ktedonosporobacter rubrisoli]QBD74618.1 NGG1p interacting factor NIF3 [Ktedonosporobacter rubrisoli]
MSTTIQDIIDSMIEAVPGAPRVDSVDTVKCGDPAQPVTGIVTTFTATMDVLRQAVQLGANLIITHEPTFYDHRDHTDWLGDDPVYQRKRDFLEQNQLAIWRYHDYWHMQRPDGIITGLLRQLGWEQYYQPDQRVLAIIPEMTLETLVAHLKEKLAMPTVRIVGNPQQSCQRLGLMVGAAGGTRQIEVFQKLDVDVLLCGETIEWQTCEYVRDANALGYNKALVILGHAKSEEDGMRYLADWLRSRVPATIPITYIAVGNPTLAI